MVPSRQEPLQNPVALGDQVGKGGPDRHAVDLALDSVKPGVNPLRANAEGPDSVKDHTQDEEADAQDDKDGGEGAISGRTTARARSPRPPTASTRRSTLARIHPTAHLSSRWVLRPSLWSRWRCPMRSTRWRPTRGSGGLPSDTRRRRIGSLDPRSLRRLGSQVAGTAMGGGRRS